MAKVRIIQLLCSARHCICGFAYESPDGEAIPERLEYFRERIKQAMFAVLDPWCGICKSRELRYDDQPTRFTTMEEAMPFLRRSEADQLASAEFLKRSQN